jgi:hypothetical protein
VVIVVCLRMVHSFQSGNPSSHWLFEWVNRYYEGPGGCLSGTIIGSHTLEEEMDHGAPYDPSGSDSGTSLHDGVIRGIGAQ